MITDPSISDFGRMAALAATARHALRDVYPLLDDDWQSVSRIAVHLGRPEELVRLCCQALCRFGWAELSQFGARRSLEVEPQAAAWLSVLDYYATFAAREFPVDLGQAGRIGDYYDMLSHVAQPAVQYLVERYRSRTGLSLLDYGCGLAPHTRQLIKTIPSATAVLVDRIEVLDLARTVIAAEELESRVMPVPLASWQELEGHKFNVVLLLNVLHELPASDQGAVLARLASKVGVGGELVVQVFCREGAAEWHADALEMATAIRLGNISSVLSFQEYVSLLRVCGFAICEQPQLQVVGGPANVLFVATKETTT